jgi:hypothetical protein
VKIKEKFPGVSSFREHKKNLEKSKIKLDRRKLVF